MQKILPHTIALTIICALFNTSLYAQSNEQHFPSDTVIQAILESRVSDARSGGIVVGLMEANGSTRFFSAGEASTKAQSFSDQSVFEIGSITKVFTGILLADMVAKGEVALDDPVMKFLPQDKVKMPTRGGKEITLLDLSTHRSGLPRMPDNFAPENEANPYIDYTTENMYEFLSNYELQRDIGASAEYSNIGVGLLGHVLTKIDGSSYVEMVRERILDPLEMNETGTTFSDLLVVGHDDSGKEVPNWDQAVLEGAGALRSNVNDMLKFIAANTGPAESSLEKTIRTSHEVRRKFQNTNIGLNWLIQDVGDDKIVWHNGGTGGYRAFVGFDPDKGVGAVVLTNSVRSIDDIGLHLINSQAPLIERTEVEVTAKILETYVGDYKLREDFVIAITVEDGTIWAQATDQPNFQIYPESEKEFFVKDFNAQITFETNDSGKTVGLVLHQGGRDMRATKQNK